jgi:hypothetical protein
MEIDLSGDMRKGELSGTGDPALIQFYDLDLVGSKICFSTLFWWVSVINDAIDF